jgi:hypothetical protein
MERVTDYSCCYRENLDHIGRLNKPDAIIWANRMVKFGDYRPVAVQSGEGDQSIGIFTGAALDIWSKGGESRA